MPLSSLGRVPHFWQMKDQLEMVLLVIILHELSHTLVKHIFPGHITPRGIGYDSSNPKYGESGDFIEKAVSGLSGVLIYHSALVRERP
jgi:hypothetical protein